MIGKRLILLKLIIEVYCGFGQVLPDIFRGAAGNNNNYPQQS